MPLPPGNARNLGPVAGTGADGAIPGIGAADLGEIVQLPDGSFVAVFGDSFGGDKVGTGPHYPSVAVPVTFNEKGRPQFGEPLNGPAGGPDPLFIPPPPARGKNTLLAGSVLVDGKTYMMAAGTSNLNPEGVRGWWRPRVTRQKAGSPSKDHGGPGDGEHPAAIIPAPPNVDLLR